MARTPLACLPKLRRRHGGFFQQTPEKKSAATVPQRPVFRRVPGPSSHDKAGEIVAILPLSCFFAPDPPSQTGSQEHNSGAEPYWA